MRIVFGVQALTEEGDMIHEVTAALQGCKDAVERGDVMTRLPAGVRDIVNRNSPHFIDDAWEIFVGDVYRFIADGWRERAEWSNGELFGCRNGLLWLTCGWPVLALGHDAAAIGAEYGA